MNEECCTQILGAKLLFIAVTLSPWSPLPLSALLVPRLQALLPETPDLSRGSAETLCEP